MCLHVLARVNGATVHTWVHMSFQILVFCTYTLRGGNGGSYGSSNFKFESTSMLFSKLTVKICNPPALYIIYSLYIFDDRLSNRCKEIPHCDYDLNVSANGYVEHVLMGCFYS